VVELWDAIGRQRIQDYILALSDYLRQSLVARFGHSCMLQPTKDQELKSGIVAFTPFLEPGQRRDFRLSNGFVEHMFKEHHYHVGMGGLDRRGLTRPPAKEATAFFDGCIPNRHPVTNRPEPTDIPFRVSAGIWLTRGDIDVFVDACEDAARKVIT